MQKTTITVSDETLERFNDAKRQTESAKIPNMPADAFLNSLLDMWEVDNSDPTPTEEGVAVGDLRDQLDRIESAAKEATNAAQNAERAAEELQR